MKYTISVTGVGGMLRLFECEEHQLEDTLKELKRSGFEIKNYWKEDDK